MDTDEHEQKESQPPSSEPVPTKQRARPILFKPPRGRGIVHVPEGPSAVGRIMRNAPIFLGAGMSAVTGLEGSQHTQDQPGTVHTQPLLQTAQPTPGHAALNQEDEVYMAARRAAAEILSEWWSPTAEPLPRIAPPEVGAEPPPPQTQSMPIAASTQEQSDSWPEITTQNLSQLFSQIEQTARQQPDARRLPGMGKPSR
jgi:hypothetical protein